MKVLLSCGKNASRPAKIFFPSPQTNLFSRWTEMQLNKKKTLDKKWGVAKKRN